MTQRGFPFFVYFIHVVQFAISVALLATFAKDMKRGNKRYGYSRRVGIYGLVVVAISILLCVCFMIIPPRKARVQFLVNSFLVILWAALFGLIGPRTLAVTNNTPVVDHAGWGQLQRVAVLTLTNFLLLFCAAGMSSESIFSRNATSGGGSDSNRSRSSDGGGGTGAPRNRRYQHSAELGNVNSTTYEPTTTAPAADGPAEPRQGPPRSREGRAAGSRNHKVSQGPATNLAAY